MSEKMSTKLQNLLANMSQEDFDFDWAKVTQHNFISPPIQEFMKNQLFIEASKNITDEIRNNMIKKLDEIDNKELDNNLKESE